MESDRLLALTFAFRPPTSIIRSIRPVVTIWAMNAGELSLQPIDPWVGEDALIVRPDINVLIHGFRPATERLQPTNIR
jgi:hypothetical protein